MVLGVGDAPHHRDLMIRAIMLEDSLYLLHGLCAHSRPAVRPSSAAGAVGAKESSTTTTQTGGGGPASTCARHGTHTTMIQRPPSHMAVGGRAV